ncbi:MAG TPA: UDP-glucose/GDP-mannose dehydrogenase family protein [Planctomycetota bacterium]|jgi:UDPglucose 6-dehydrogenase|nr:UDP-glucose/GDP-mannose dehydrogenase family protein [Planctomycetota bacterium]
MKLSVLGTGYVGLVTGSCFADLGNDVVCFDIDLQKIEALRQGRVPIYEPGLEELVQRNASEGRLVFTADLKEAVKGREVIFVCVGTPQRSSGKADTTYVMQAIDSLGRELEEFTVIVNKSTVPIGTAARATRLLQELTKVDFEVVSNPEFLKEGAAIKDFQNPDRVIIGTESERAQEVMARLYSPLARVNRPILFMKPEAAELVKYAANAMLASRISFMNALTGLCEKVGADIKDIAKGIGLDTRIGARFLQASPGYGGSCFPKDVRALVDTMESLQLNANFFRAIDQVNELHKKSHLARVKKYVPELHNETIGVWGLAFKPRTDDIRESPSLTLIEQLLEAGAHVLAYDPEAAENARKAFPSVQYGHTPYDVVKGASAVVVMTEWDVFRNLDFQRVKSLMKKPVIVDCRNIYEPQEMTRLGFSYAGMGRAAAEPWRVKADRPVV